MKRHAKMAEIHAICEEFDWQIEPDNYGQIVIYTGLTSDDNDNLRELEEKDLLANDDNH